MTRVSDFPIASMFLERWSPRAFDGSVISHTDLMTIIEAGRWAPSCYNYQPWRFIYIHREAEDWDQHIDRLDPLNQDWAAHASALVYLVTDTLMGPSEEALAPSHFHGFDGGGGQCPYELTSQCFRVSHSGDGRN